MSDLRSRQQERIASLKAERAKHLGEKVPLKRKPSTRTGVTQAQATVVALEKLGAHGTSGQILTEMRRLNVTINKDHLGSKLSAMKEERRETGRRRDRACRRLRKVVYALP